jgi:hypothetical protein
MRRDMSRASRTPATAIAPVVPGVPSGAAAAATTPAASLDRGNGAGESAATESLVVVVAGGAATTTAAALTAVLPEVRGRPAALVEADPRGGAVTTWWGVVDSSTSGCPVGACTGHCGHRHVFGMPTNSTHERGHELQNITANRPVMTGSGVLVLALPSHPAEALHVSTSLDYISRVIDLIDDGHDLVIDIGWEDSLPDAWRHRLPQSATSVRVETVRQDQRSVAAASVGVHRAIARVAAARDIDHGHGQRVVLAVVGHRPFTADAVARELEAATAPMVAQNQAVMNPMAIATVGTMTAESEHAVVGRPTSTSSTEPMCVLIDDDPRTAALLAGRPELTGRRWRRSRLRSSVRDVARFICATLPSEAAPPSDVSTAVSSAQYPASDQGQQPVSHYEMPPENQAEAVSNGSSDTNSEFLGGPRVNQ